MENQLLFLKTNLEYEWPKKTGIKEVPWAFLAVFTLGLSAVIRNRLIHKGEKGDKTVWPFYRESDYQTALCNQPYLKKETEPARGPYAVKRTLLRQGFGGQANFHA